MMRTYTEELAHRKTLREKYLETPGYRRWSDYLRQVIFDYHFDASLYDAAYGRIDDNYLFMCMVTHKQPDYIDMSDVIRSFEFGSDLPIHWDNFYAYFDEQSNDLNSLHHPSTNIKNILDEYRDKLLNNYDMI